ncbi:MAG: class I SAM-dependent methyltransferase [Candidatus Bathyarchaeia archaeon]|jgi:SAM-dependent methyltransferase
MKKLNPEEDAFGQALLAAYKGEEVHEIVERDDGFADAMSTRGYFSDYESWSPMEQEGMHFVKGRILDVGCGAGRHSLYLQEKGFDVFGIDVSPLAIKVCKLRGLKKTGVMPIEAVNFKPDSFETIIMMGNNFGLFGSFKKARRFLKKFYRMTSKDALIVATSRDPYKTDNPAHLYYHKLNRERGRMSGQVRIRIRYEKCISKWFDYLMVSGEEMAQILSGTGWKVKEFLDTGEPYYVAIVKKIGYS